MIWQLTILAPIVKSPRWSAGQYPHKRQPLANPLLIFVDLILASANVIRIV